MEFVKSVITMKFGMVKDVYVCRAISGYLEFVEHVILIPFTMELIVFVIMDITEIEIVAGDVMEHVENVQVPMHRSVRVVWI